MSKEPKLYEVLNEAEEIVEKLCENEKIGKILWAVVPKQVAVLCITNKERPKSLKTIAKITRVSKPTEAVLDANKIDIRYIIELYASDWQSMSMAQKQAVIFHELLHIPSPLENGAVKHDVEDFAIMIDAFGPNWISRNEDLPEILRDDVEFDMSLLPNKAEE